MIAVSAATGAGTAEPLTNDLYMPTTPPATDLVPPIADWLAQLRASGYRLTAARRALVDLLATSQRPLSARQLYTLAQATHPDLGMATVYRTLEKLEELRLIQRVHDHHGCHRYVGQAGQLVPAVVICAGCGRLEPLDEAMLHPLFQQLQQQSNYQIQHYWLQVSGLCADCQP